MGKGAKWRLYVPYELAYGAQGSPGGIPPYSALIFDVELIDIL
jgi:FKBP-type peptidyl-prolyl cis-trans isomerase FklB